jgi:predicted metal-dependent hydrolase
LETNLLDLGHYKLEIVKKKIKHIYFRIYPSRGKIIVSAPVNIDRSVLNKAIASKADWLEKHIQKRRPAPIEHAPDKTYTTGETIFFKGKKYSLNVVDQDKKPQVFISSDTRIDLGVKPGSDEGKREKIMREWYRRELKASIGMYVTKWQPIMGVSVNEFNVRKMKTRWGSCNIRARRIWLSLNLIEFDGAYLEYVVVHEMAHLLERKHNARFMNFMDTFLPGWRILKKNLDLANLHGHFFY